MTATTERLDGSCRHCGSPLPGGSVEFCCEGCGVVAAALAATGMAERYYALGGGRGAPAADAARAHDRLWLQPIATTLRGSVGPSHLVLDVQGLHCSACVWALEELFSRRTAARSLLVDPVLGRLFLDVDAAFDLEGYVDDVERLGYRLGPPEKRAAAGGTIVARTGIAIAIAMNVMSFALAEYFGLSEEPLRSTLRMLSMVLAGVALAVGLPPFARAAIEGLRTRVLTLELPIALGMVLVGVMTTEAWLVHGESAYADTLAVFVALMLVGRLLEERSLARAKQALLSGDAPTLYARRSVRGRVEVVRADEIGAGDELVVASGEVVPVAARLDDTVASVGLDWITGESEPLGAARGERLEAGAVNVGTSALRATALEAFDGSKLRTLFERPLPGPKVVSRLEAFLARGWTIAVLVAATGTFVGWLLASGDLEAALRATTAVLVVTCPCGLGIATPLARELARARLRRNGLVVRTARTLARAAEVRRVVFDKTGTLTTGRPEIVDTLPLAALSSSDRAIVASIAARSAHPRSDALRRALRAVPASVELDVVEEPGRGLWARVDGDVWRVGSPELVGGGEGDLVVGKNGRVLCDLRSEEHLREGAQRDVAALRARGLDVSILSGDTVDRVRALARRVGIEREAVIGRAAPADKAAWLRAHDPTHTLFVGDGVNDLPAAVAAGLSGTPAIDRPFLPARTDFHFTTAGLGPIVSLLETADTLRRVARRNALLAVAYNTLAVPLAAAGAMPPWLAAVLMPASSLVVIGSTIVSLGGRRAPRVAAPRPTVALPLAEGALAWRS